MKKLLFLLVCAAMCLPGRMVGAETEKTPAAAYEAAWDTFRKSSVLPSLNIQELLTYARTHLESWQRVLDSENLKNLQNMQFNCDRAIRILTTATQNVYFSEEEKKPVAALLQEFEAFSQQLAKKIKSAPLTAEEKTHMREMIAEAKRENEKARVSEATAMVTPSSERTVRPREEKKESEEETRSKSAVVPTAAEKKEAEQVIEKSAAQLNEISKKADADVQFLKDMSLQDLQKALKKLEVTIHPDKHLKEQKLFNDYLVKARIAAGYWKDALEHKEPTGTMRALEEAPATSSTLLLRPVASAEAEKKAPAKPEKTDVEKLCEEYKEAVDECLALDVETSEGAAAAYTKLLKPMGPIVKTLNHSKDFSESIVTAYDKCYGYRYEEMKKWRTRAMEKFSPKRTAKPATTDTKAAAATSSSSSSSSAGGPLASSKAQVKAAIAMQQKQRAPESATPIPEKDPATLAQLRDSREAGLSKFLDSVSSKIPLYRTALAENGLGANIEDIINLKAKLSGLSKDIQSDQRTKLLSELQELEKEYRTLNLNKFLDSVSSSIPLYRRALAENGLGANIEDIINLKAKLSGLSKDIQSDRRTKLLSELQELEKEFKPLAASKKDVAPASASDYLAKSAEAEASVSRSFEKPQSATAKTVTTEQAEAFLRSSKLDSFMEKPGNLSTLISKLRRANYNFNTLKSNKNALALVKNLLEKDIAMVGIDLIGSPEKEDTARKEYANFLRLAASELPTAAPSSSAGGPETVTPAASRPLAPSEAQIRAAIAMQAAAEKTEKEKSPEKEEQAYLAAVDTAIATSPTTTSGEKLNELKEQMDAADNQFYFALAKQKNVRELPISEYTPLKEHALGDRRTKLDNWIKAIDPRLIEYLKQQELKKTPKMGESFAQADVAAAQMDTGFYSVAKKEFEQAKKIQEQKNRREKLIEISNLFGSKRAKLIGKYTSKIDDSPSKVVSDFDKEKLLPLSSEISAAMHSVETETTPAKAAAETSAAKETPSVTEQLRERREKLARSEAAAGASSSSASGAPAVSESQSAREEALATERLRQQEIAREQFKAKVNEFDVRVNNMVHAYQINPSMESKQLSANVNFLRPKLEGFERELTDLVREGERLGDNVDTSRPSISALRVLIGAYSSAISAATPVEARPVVERPAVPARLPAAPVREERPALVLPVAARLPLARTALARPAAVARPALALPAAPIDKLSKEDREKVTKLQERIATSRDATAAKIYQAQSDLLLAKAGMAISGEDAVAAKLTPAEKTTIESLKARISKSKDATAQGIYLKQITDIITAAKKRK